MTATLLVLVTGCSAPPQSGTTPAPPPPAPSPAAGLQSPTSPVEAAYEAALSATDDSFGAAFDKLKELLPQVDGEFVTEGDLLRTEDELRRDIEASRRDRIRRASGQTPQVVFGPELTAALRPNGTQDFWEAGKRTLTYAIDRGSFKDPQRAALVEGHIKQAIADWEGACTVQQKCDLKFIFRDDAKPTHKDNTFIVKHVNAKGAFIAAAFFPSYPSARRFVYIDPSFFTTLYDKTGVLRHELGHALGYRHEHIRDILGCRQEGTQWLPITPYDPHSVMHYLCGGGGTLSLQLTDRDKEGHVKAYGGQ
jgi:hypothetical protein